MWNSFTNKLMHRLLTISIILVLGAFGAEARSYDRGYESIPSTTFVPKGTWMTGGTVRYSQHINNNYDFLVISDINSTGYNISGVPKILYMFKDNMGLGLRVSYDRSMLDLTAADLSFSEITMNVRDCYQIQHKLSTHAVYRAYIPLLGSKRIAMFADILLGGSYKEGKAYNAASGSFIGSYQQVYSAELAVDPGIAAFLNDRLALELNLGMFNVGYSWTNQVHNQIETGRFDSIKASYMVNLLSLGIGLSYYFL